MGFLLLSLSNPSSTRFATIRWMVQRPSPQPTKAPLKTSPKDASGRIHKSTGRAGATSHIHGNPPLRIGKSPSSSCRRTAPSGPPKALMARWTSPASSISLDAFDSRVPARSDSTPEIAPNRALRAHDHSPGNTQCCQGTFLSSRDAQPALQNKKPLAGLFEKSFYEDLIR